MHPPFATRANLLRRHRPDLAPWAGIDFPWVSAQVLAPLCIGVVGLIAFLVYECCFCEYPVVRIFHFGRQTLLSNLPPSLTTSAIRLVEPHQPERVSTTFAAEVLRLMTRTVSYV